MSGLYGTRVGTVPDVAMIGEALKRPGMDTRVWSEQAVVERIVVDAEHGVLVDVVCLSTGLAETAKLFAAYNGARYGLHLPVLVDDEVLVLAPMGEPDFGLIAFPPRWDAADPPPLEIVDHPEDVVLVVREDTNLRIVLTGDGNAIVDARGSGKVFLGAESGTDRNAREGDSITVALGDLSALQVNLDARYTLGAGASLTAVNGVINSGSDKVESA